MMVQQKKYIILNIKLLFCDNSNIKENEDVALPIILHNLYLNASPGIYFGE